MPSSTPSAVSGEWLEREVLEPVADLAEGIAWVAVDPGDGELVLTRVAESARRAGKTAHELTCYPSDPYLLWSALVGSTGPDGLIWESEPGDVVVVYGSEQLGEAQLVDLEPHLSAAARGFGLLVVLATLHAEVVEQHAVFEVGTMFQVARFTDCPEKDRRALAEEVVARAAARTGWTPPTGLPAEIAKAAPTRRVLLRWVAHISELPPDEDWMIPPDLPPTPVLALGAISSDKLADEYRSAMRKVDKAERRYSAWRATSLFQRWRPPEKALPGTCARGWFQYLVSALSCQLFDAADPAALGTLAELQRTDAGVQAHSASADFLRLLRAIRTRYQHGLTWRRVRDRDTDEQVRRWFLDCCGTVEPETHHWRLLCVRLLESANRMLDSLNGVLECIEQNEMARRAVSTQLDQTAVNLPRYEWIDILRSVCGELHADLDPGLLFEKHGTDLASQLRAECPARGHLATTAQRVATALVVALLRRPPISGADLAKSGLRGPQIRVGLERVQELFERGETTPERLVAAAVALFEDAGATAEEDSQ